MWSNQQFSGDWALNPSAYQNVSHEDVDWASLAQQWIKMKEATTALITPPPPPTSASAIADKNEEKGEAPMDMETDDKAESTADPSTWGNWPNWQQSWGWNWSGDANSEQGSSSKEPYGYTSTFEPGENSATIEYNHGAGSTNQPVYWTGQSAGAPDVSSQKDSKAYTRSSRYTWRRSERDRDRDKDRIKGRDSKEDDADEDSADTLDAAKRKQLPLWIREGLEKMEREKQRKFDKEKADKERDEYLRRKKAEDDVALSKMDSVEAAKFMARSKFDSDGSEGEHDKIPVVRQRKSRFHEDEGQIPSAPSTLEMKREKSKTPPPIEPMKTREEMLEDLMMDVRRTLTEILLDVTTEEIESISRQVYQKARSKAPAKRLRKSQAFASIAGKSGLGLGIYGSDDDTDSDDSNTSIRKTAHNSDEELEEVIRQKKENFAKTEAEIEAQLEAEDAREQMAREVVNTSEDESDAGFGQVEHISHVHDAKKEISRSRGIDDDSGKRRKKISESETYSEILKDDSISNEKKDKNNDLSSDGSSSNVSNLSNRRKSFKRKRKRSSGSSDEKITKKKSETSEDENEKSKRKTKKKRNNVSSDENNSKDNEDEAEHEDYKKKHKNHDHEKRHKKIKKPDKDEKRDSDRAKKSNRRSLSRVSEDRHRGKRRSKSQDVDRRARRRSRSRDNEHRRRHSRSREEYRRRRSRSYDSGSRRGRSRTREFEHRRNRSRSKESFRRKRSRSRESNNRRKRSRSKEVDRKHGRRRGRSSS